MKDSLKRFRVEKISNQALAPTPENLQEEAVGFMLSEGWLRENKPLERIEVDPEGEGRVRVNGSECLD
jgi:formate dehydrogenase assembly factor FdhD